MKVLIMDLSGFLFRAKISTYATVGEGGEKFLKDGSKEFVYQEKDYKYRDRYFGFNPFIGQEIVRKNDKLIWGMNYYGSIAYNIVSEKMVYEFLKKALQTVPKAKPFRGADHYTRNDFEYHNKSKGTIEKFTGTEKIYYKGQEIYSLHYHGGLIK